MGLTATPEVVFDVGRESILDGEWAVCGRVVAGLLSRLLQEILARLFLRLGEIEDRQIIGIACIVRRPKGGIVLTSCRVSKAGDPKPTLDAATISDGTAL